MYWIWCYWKFKKIITLKQIKLKDLKYTCQWFFNIFDSNLSISMLIKTDMIQFSMSNEGWEIK